MLQDSSIVTGLQKIIKIGEFQTIYVKWDVF